MAVVDQMNDFAAALGSWEACMLNSDESVSESKITPAAGPPPGLEMMGVPAKIMTSELADWPSDAMGAPAFPADIKKQPAKIIIAPAEETVAATAVLAPVQPVDTAKPNACISTKAEKRTCNLEPTCSDCGTDEPGWGKFCMDCGSQRKLLPAALPPICANCGTDEPGTGKFCMECGTRRQPEETAPAKPVVVVEPAASAAAESVVAPAIDEDILKIIRTTQAVHELQSAIADLQHGSSNGNVTASAIAPGLSGLEGKGRTTLSSTAAPFASSFATDFAVPNTSLSVTAAPYLGPLAVPTLPMAGYDATFGASQAPASGQPTMVKPASQYVVPGETIRTHLQQLQGVDAARVLLVRKINRLGFESDNILKEHYSWYGNVENVFVSHSRVKATHNSTKKVISSRVRPSGMGFVVMSTVEEAKAILAAGGEQVVQGATIYVQSYEHHEQGDENPQDGPLEEN